MSTPPNENQERLDALAAASRVAADEIKRLGEEDVPKIREETFVNKLLPILTNTSGNVDVSIWQDYAGSVTRPIDVYDAAGRHLFRVPPLVTRPVTNHHNDPARSVSHLLGEAKLRHEVHPVMGQTYLHEGLNAKFANLGLGVDLEKARAWSAILERYGYAPLLPSEKAPAATSGSETASEETLFSDEDDEL